MYIQFFRVGVNSLIIINNLQTLQLLSTTTSPYRLRLYGDSKFFTTTARRSRRFSISASSAMNAL